MITGEQFQLLSDISFYSELNCIIRDQNKQIKQNIHKISDFCPDQIVNYKKIFNILSPNSPLFSG